MKYIIIADDYTGANDTGVQLKRRGLPVDVIPYPVSGLTDSECLVVDTETRNIPEDEAALRLSELTEKLFKEKVPEVVYKKVDSTLRGNINAEIRTLAKGFDAVLFAPAFPQINRTTRHGIHYLDGVPLLQTEMARDPISPIKSDRLEDYLIGSKPKIKGINAPQLDSLVFEKGVSYYADASSQEDLEKLTKKALQSKLRILWVGSAGLANAIFEILIPANPILAVVGSLSEVAAKQIDALEQTGVQIVSVPSSDLIKGQSSETMLEKILSALKKERVACLTGARSREEYDETILRGREQGLSKGEINSRVQQALSNLVFQIMARQTLGGIFLTGGDTAIATFRALGAEGSRILGESEPGFILSRLIGGSFEGLPIITKAGAFGHETSIVKAIKKLEEESLQCNPF